MNYKKESFILYADTAQHIRLLSDEQTGLLFRLLLDFAADGTCPAPDEIGDNLVALAFSFLSDRIRRDQKKFLETCEKRREAGRKGAEVTNRKRWGACSDGKTPGRSRGGRQMSAKSAEHVHDPEHDPEYDHHPEHESEHDPGPLPHPEAVSGPAGQRG